MSLKKSKEKKSTVLFIDDEPAWLEIIRLAVPNDKLKIVTAEGGEAALKVLHKKVPDLIMSDVRMPFINGFDLFQQVKKDPKLNKIPYVFMSSIDDFDAKRTAKEIGADGYIEKPFDSEQIRNIISDLLSRFHHR
ncbi:MAG: response regulator [Bacteroidota bacterium]|nr:response regulator [Bacteroidota bacterium]